MGKGDRKSRRGKITLGSYGVRRPRKKKKNKVLASSTSESPKQSEITEIASATKTKKTVSKKTTTSKKTNKSVENNE
ncbi:MAG: 30S ribosomal protein THX [Bacteroidales bacterium]|nr:30S ribosomal protein THX [Bacteroidales bacterium]